MSNSINSQNPIPSYSGVTLNITNPTVNTNQNPYITSPYPNQPSNVEKINPTITYEYNQNLPTIQDPVINNPQKGFEQSYPPQYYLNNYNYFQDSQKETSSKITSNMPEIIKNQSLDEKPIEQVSEQIIENDTTETKNMDISNEIINDLDARKEKETLEKNNSEKTNIVALTNEYIMSLENYLNNPNSEIRLMAAKDILTRLNEDESRVNDAALNALLNKMMQDPDKIIRVAALSAFSSGLACGNDYTIELLNKIQNDPKADKEDVVQAANILLKMSTTPEIKYSSKPLNNKNSDNEVEN